MNIELNRQASIAKIKSELDKILEENFANEEENLIVRLLKQEDNINKLALIIDSNIRVHEDFKFYKSGGFKILDEEYTDYFDQFILSLEFDIYNNNADIDIYIDINIDCNSEECE